MSNITPDVTNGFVSDEELVAIADQDSHAGATTVPCAVAGGLIALSAALPGFCPTGACTTRC